VVGPAVRAAGDFTGPLSREQRLQRAIQLSALTRVTCLSGRPTPAVVRRLAMVRQLRNHQGFVGSLDALERGDQAAFVERMAAIKVPAVQLQNWTMLRWVWSRHRERTFVDRPQVIGLHVFSQPGDPTDGIRFATDVVLNGVGVLPAAADAEDPLPAAAIRLEQGVLDTVLETVVLRGVGESLGENPSTLMAAGGEWRVVEDPASLGELPADWRARFAADRERGLAVVAPSAPVGERAAVGWWRVDPETGTCLGLGVNGWGPETTEYSVLATMTRAQIAVLRAQMFLAHNAQRIALACALCKITNMGLTMGGVNLPSETSLICATICAGVGSS